MVVVGGPRAEQTQDFVILKKMRVCAFLVRSLLIWFPKVAQILPKVVPNPWGFGLGLRGPPYRAHRAL